MFLFLLFLHFRSCSSFFPVPLISFTIFSVSFLPFCWRRHKMTQKGWRAVKSQNNQSIESLRFACIFFFFKTIQSLCFCFVVIYSLYLSYFIPNGLWLRLRCDCKELLSIIVTRTLHCFNLFIGHKYCFWLFRVNTSYKYVNKFKLLKKILPSFPVFCDLNSVSILTVHR